MSARFWLSRKAVPMTLADVAQLSDLQARDLLARMRWGEDGQVCPSCGAVDYHYVVRGRYQWRFVTSIVKASPNQNGCG